MSRHTHRKKFVFWTLLTSFCLGLAMITNGLASLPAPYETPSLILLTPDPNEAKILQPRQKIDSETISFSAPPVDNNKRLYKVKPGDTFSRILQEMKIDDLEIAYVSGEVNDKYRLTQIRPGIELDIELTDDEENDGMKHLKSLKFRPSVTEYVTATLSDNNDLKVEYGEIPLKKILIQASGEIEGSFYQSAIRAGVTDSVMAQLITAFSYVIDFQRDIQPGQKFTILFEGYTDSEGHFIKSNRPLYAKLELRKNKVEEIIFVPKNGSLAGFYRADGSSIRKALLRTPVDGARITSGFGMRRHPILGFSKMHKGTDFGAPTGTPIYSAGDGIIQDIGYRGAYGNYIRIQHNGTYSTAYAHISRFARGKKKGIRVKQGEIIAYVGTTGRSTGPHLHYEVLKNGTQINPVSVNLPISDKLSGKELANFTAEKKRIMAALSAAPTRAELTLKAKQAAAAEKAKKKADEAKLTLTPKAENN